MLDKHLRRQKEIAQEELQQLQEEDHTDPAPLAQLYNFTYEELATLANDTQAEFDDAHEAT